MAVAPLKLHLQGHDIQRYSRLHGFMAVAPLKHVIGDLSAVQFSSLHGFMAVAPLKLREKGVSTALWPWPH